MDKPPGMAQLPPGPEDPAAMAGQSALIAGVCVSRSVSKGLCGLFKKTRELMRMMRFL